MKRRLDSLKQVTSIPTTAIRKNYDVIVDIQLEKHQVGGPSISTMACDKKFLFLTVKELLLEHYIPTSWFSETVLQVVYLVL